MMQSREIEYEASEKALRFGLPFALYLFPGDISPTFLAGNPENGTVAVMDPVLFSGFIYSKFSLQPEIEFKGIRPDYDAEAVMALSLPECRNAKFPELQFCSTGFEEYCKSIERVVASLDNDDEKVVISRVEAIISQKSPVRIAERYFSAHPDCFRYLYYTPDAGVWLGASPELAAEIDSDAETIHTMSLAGTRFGERMASWDRKNRLEHDVVTRHFVAVLSEAGLSVEPTVETEVAFGEVTHLCHKIDAHGSIEAAPLLGRLFPSPALLGYPRQKAFDIISANESHCRICYGGLVGITESRDGSGLMRLYVNLRCCAACRLDGESSYLYNLYGGGGITPRSDAAEEWEETVRKLRSLRLLFMTPDSGDEHL